MKNKKVVLFLVSIIFAFKMQGQDLQEYINIALENNPEVINVFRPKAK